MGTTVWVDETTRAHLRRLQESLGTSSVNETIRRLLEQPATDARGLFTKHGREIRRIMRQHGIRNMTAFGSRARGDARPGSDLDVAVEMKKDARPLAVLAAEADLEEELGLSVHLVELPKAELHDIIRREGIRFAG